MRSKILIFLIFTVYCFSQINADSKHSIEGNGIDRLAKRGVFKATALAEEEKLNPILNISALLDKLIKALEKILSLGPLDKDPKGLLAQIIKKVIELLNELLPEKLQLSIIKIEITKNVIIIKIGEGDVPEDPEPTDPPTPVPDPEDPPTPVPVPPVPLPTPVPVPPVYPPYYYPPVQPSYSQPIYYKQPSQRPVYLSKPTYIFVKPSLPSYGNGNNYASNSALDSVAY